MELVTKQGWCSVYTAEAVVTQFASQVAKKGRVEVGQQPYNPDVALETFRRISENHEKRGCFQNLLISITFEPLVGLRPIFF